MGVARNLEKEIEARQALGACGEKKTRSPVDRAHNQLKGSKKFPMGRMKRDGYETKESQKVGLPTTLNQMSTGEV